MKKKQQSETSCIFSV